MPRNDRTPGGKPDPSSAAHAGQGQHSVVQWPAVPQDNDPAQDPAAMRLQDGSVMVAGSPEDATLAYLEGGQVISPDRWPWPGIAGTPAVPDPSEMCADPDGCFPNGIAPGTAGAACIHTGGQTHWFGPPV